MAVRPAEGTVLSACRFVHQSQRRSGHDEGPAGVRERINALVETGISKADAFRQLAEETGQPAKSLQGAYYQHSRKANGGSTRSRTSRETTPEDAVAQATTTLEKALDAIDREVEAAKERADEAKREHEALKASAASRKQAIKAKIDALKA